MNNQSELNSWRVIKSTGEGYEDYIVSGELFENDQRQRTDQRKLQDAAFAQRIRENNIQARKYERMELLKQNKHKIAGAALFALSLLGITIGSALANNTTEQSKAHEVADAKASSALIMEGFHRNGTPWTIAQGIFHIDLSTAPASILPRSEPIVIGNLSDAISNRESNIMGINLYDPDANGDNPYSTQENPVITIKGESVDGSKLWMSRRFQDGPYGEDTIGWVPVNKNTEKYITRVNPVTGEESLVTVEGILNNTVSGVSASDNGNIMQFGPGPGLERKDNSILPVDLVVDVPSK